jgi:hypothetical protein
MKVIGITSFHSAEELRSENVLHIIEDYNDVSLNILFGEKCIRICELAENYLP